LVEILDGSLVSILNPVSPVTLNGSTVAILASQAAGAVDASQLPAAFGHGTMVAGLVHLVAPTAKIMPLKVFKADGTSNVFDVVRAIRYAVDHGARVINMSFSDDCLTRRSMPHAAGHWWHLRNSGRGAHPPGYAAQRARRRVDDDCQSANPEPFSNSAKV
jgi:subtilisin family serine protease